MVFSSVPPYLDHHNWHHQFQQGSAAGGDENPNLLPPPALPPAQPPQRGGGTGGEGSIRPGSMVDRARLAKLPLPEPGLNCPRCDSTNTKFCYFNNYSLTQPRYFCKACKRYWTHGGALRNVPVGGSCRRNKRNNKRNSKSPNQARPKSITHESPSSNCSIEDMVNTQNPHPPSLQLPFMTSLGQYGAIGSSNLSNFQPQNEMGSFQLGSSSSRLNNFNNILSIGGGENWRMPFLAGFEVSNNTNLFQYQSENVVEEVPSSSIVRGDSRLTNCAIDNNVIDPPVKIEEPRGLNLSRQFLDVSENTNQEPWVENTWEDFSGVNSSSTSTTHFL